MFQAAIIPITAPKQGAIAELLRRLWSHYDDDGQEAVRAGTDEETPVRFRDRVELLRKRAELLRDQANDIDPLMMAYYVEGLIVTPLAALRRDPAARESPYVADRLADADWELGTIGSIGDTLDPVADRDDCLSCAECALDEVATFLAGVVRSLRP